MLTVSEWVATVFLEICTSSNVKPTPGILQGYAESYLILAELFGMVKSPTGVGFTQGSTFSPWGFSSFPAQLCMEAAGALNLVPGEAGGKLVIALLC